MKIQLQKLDHNETLSRETPAFTATLVVDGVERGQVQNDGSGQNKLPPSAARWKARSQTYQGIAAANGSASNYPQL